MMIIQAGFAGARHEELCSARRFRSALHPDTGGINPPGSLCRNNRSFALMSPVADNAFAPLVPTTLAFPAPDFFQIGQRPASVAA
jgi:hypothetical protein